MKRVIAYIRVSTEGQTPGLGFQRQMARIEAFAHERGYRILKTYREIHTGMGSASIKDRRQLQDALARAKKHKCPIIISSYDRLGRHKVSTEELIEKSGVNIFSTEHGENADKAILAAAAREAEIIGKRISDTTKKALKEVKKQGKKLGNQKNLSEAQKIGQETNRRNARLMAEEYAPILRQIIAGGSTTKKQIADNLNNLGLRTARKKLWSAGNVRRIYEVAKSILQEEKNDQVSQRIAKDPLWGKFA